MKDSGTSLITDKASLMALITGTVTGLSVVLWRTFFATIPEFLVGPQLQLVLILALLSVLKCAALGDDTDTFVARW